MGQKLSLEEQRNRKQYIYTYFPGLSQQLDMTFACHDLSTTGILSFSVLEPILRHLLMQYGLIEYVTRYIDENGCLDHKHIRNELSLFGLKVGKSAYTCDDFKSLATIWLQKILDTYSDDQAKWQEKLLEEQKNQVNSYAEAMKSFQSQYAQQQAVYQQGIQEQQKQIAEWNKLLEETHRTQQQVYEAEIRRMEEIKLREANAAEEAAKEHLRIIAEYKSQLKKLAETDDSGICFVYPASCAPYGACASAGAQEPCRRKRERKRDSDSRAVAGFC
ncbi:hypothetical protein IE077_001925 [Cardiosporidium cionae]|uniref:Uncharacterized protein n=1 Tax=Cardiosporidium cionae TaxID=476202 RepID=A0ABQ7JCC2_9APIC|nr:hypothetical protein IE077_001925 [Cardiosporidium cionae]|eukprot:KAF8821534.1 hypothetical protein IE077_001925 [Cardiosporidium cionae]